MRKFKVAIVERGKEALWRDYWITDGSKDGADAALLNWDAPKLWKQQTSRRQSIPFNAATRIAPLCLLATNITYREFRN